VRILVEIGTSFRFLLRIRVFIRTFGRSKVYRGSFRNGYGLMRRRLESCSFTRVQSLRVVVRATYTVLNLRISSISVFVDAFIAFDLWRLRALLISPILLVFTYILGIVAVEVLSCDLVETDTVSLFFIGGLIHTVRLVNELGSTAVLHFVFGGMGLSGSRPEV